MGGEWREVPFADVIEIISGGTPKTSVSEYWGGSIPWLSVSDFNTGFRWVSTAEKTITERGLAESATTILNRGDIIISARGTVGVIAQLAKPMAFNQSCYGVRGKRGIVETNFVYYALRHAVSQMLQVAHGGVFNTITRDTFKIITTKLPPLPEQRAIAHILGTLDDKIELNRRMNQTLEEMARALFKSWFVDFDPVCAKAAVRREHPNWSNAQVSRAACPTLKPEIAELFPDEFENSELGEIPKGWRVSRLGDIADVNWGDTNVTKSSYVNEGYLAYSAKGPDGFLSYYDYDCVGVVVSAIGANSGFTWLARGKWSCIKNTIRFWSIVSDISTEYLYFATHGNNIWPLRGSAQPFISQTDAQNLRVLHPSNGLARKFGDTISPLFDRIDFSIHESRTLAALRDTLLPKLISGVLRVKDAERFLKRMGESFIGVS